MSRQASVTQGASVSEGLIALITQRQGQQGCSCLAQPVVPGVTGIVGAGAWDRSVLGLGRFSDATVSALF